MYRDDIYFLGKFVEFSHKVSNGPKFSVIMFITIMFRKTRIQDILQKKLLASSMAGKEASNRNLEAGDKKLLCGHEPDSK